MGGRMDTIQAAVLNVKLKHYPSDLKKRQQVAHTYTTHLGGNASALQKEQKTTLPYIGKNRDEIIQKPKTKNQKLTIPTAVHYPMPLHLQECFQYLGYKKGDFPVAEKISREIMSLPMNPYLSDKEIAYISEAF